MADRSDAAASPETPRKTPIPPWADYLVLAVVFAALAAWSWRKWPDVLVDFGIDLYIPWRMAEGDTLYVDIAWKNGPFAQYLNLLWFRLFGVSLSSLIFVNLAILAGTTVLIHRFFKDLFDRLTAVVVGVTFLCLFGFAHLSPMGNFNYVCPYRHEQLDGTVCAVAALFVFGAYLRRPARLSLCGLVGVLLGLVFMTKIELMVAAVGSIVLGLILTRLSGPFSGLKLGRAGLWMLGGWMAPVVFFLVVLWVRMPLARAARGVAGNWGYLFNSGIGQQSFFQWSLGLDQPVQNLLLLVEYFGWIMAAVAAAVGIDRLCRKASRPDLLGLALGPAVFLVLAFVPTGIPWLQLGRPLPLLAGLMWVWSLVAWHRRRHDEGDCRKLVLTATWAAFALGMLGKMALNARLYQYGFTLAMPAVLLVPAFLTAVVPARLKTLGMSGNVFRPVMLGAWAACCWYHLNVSNHYYQLKTFALGEGGDAMMTYAPQASRTGEIMAQAVEDLRTRMPAEATLVVMPEGITLNYLLRRANPTPYTIFDPYDLATFGGEAATLEVVKTRPPDFIAVVQRDMREYGTDLFGVDPVYGRQIMAWVRENYAEVKVFGNSPFSRDGFGIAVFQRRRASPAPSLGNQ